MSTRRWAILRPRGIRERVDAYAVGPGITVGAGSPLIPTLRGGVVLPEAVVSAMAARQNAAADMAARWLSVSGGGRDELVNTLGQALLAEEAARYEFYQTADQLSLADRLALLHDKQAWLVVKYRVRRTRLRRLAGAGVGSAGCRYRCGPVEHLHRADQRLWSAVGHPRRHRGGAGPGRVIAAGRFVDVSVFSRMRMPNRSSVRSLPRRPGSCGRGKGMPV